MSALVAATLAMRRPSRCALQLSGDTGYAGGIAALRMPVHVNRAAGGRDRGTVLEGCGHSQHPQFPQPFDAVLGDALDVH